MTAPGRLHPEINSGTGLELDIYNAIASVDDPEYPGISIIDLGLVESVRAAEDGVVEIGLVPTFSGCPALGLIAEDVRMAVSAVPGVTGVDVEWLRRPTWSIERVTEHARAALARDFTVAVTIGAGPPTCPRCGSPTNETSMFGPSRCRSVHRCENCRENVEVMRG